MAILRALYVIECRIATDRHPILLKIVSAPLGARLPVFNQDRLQALPDILRDHMTHAT